MVKTNSPIEVEFFKKLAAGDLDRIRAAVASSPELLNSYDYRNFGATPLTMACFAGRLGLAQTLVELGADPNRCSDWQMGPWSPLHCAIYRRDKAMAEWLLSHGATLDVHTAAGLGRCDWLVELLDKDPDRVRESGGDGCQPLHFADSVAVAQLLLERGADINARCIDHYSAPVQYLCTSRPDVARFLLAEGAAADIFSTIACDDLSRMEFLLEDNPKVIDGRINQKHFPPGPEHDVHNVMTFTLGQDLTPLHVAAKCDNGPACSILIRRGISTQVRGGYDHATPLHLAAWSNCAESAKVLIEHGAEIESRSGHLHNNTPAGWAIVAGADDVFELLIECGATVHPWFLDDARDACAGRFNQVSPASAEQRQRILRRLS